MKILTRILICQAISALTSVAAYGPFYGNRDLLCNRGTRFACYCSTVTWRRFNRTDAPQCTRIFPGFEAAILELANCDVRLEDNPHSNSPQVDDEARAATTFERYFKRTLATLILRECQPANAENDQRCSKIPADLNEEHIVFTQYQCSKDLRTSRLWMIVLGKPDNAAEQETTPQEEEHFVDGNLIARVLKSATVIPQLNLHLSQSRSHVINVEHQQLDDTFKGAVVQKLNKPVQAVESKQDKDQVGDEGESSTVSVDAAEATGADVGPESHKSVMNDSVTPLDTTVAKFNWVAALVGVLFAAYFLVVWVLSVIFCMRKRREIQAKNRRLRGDLRNSDHIGIQDEKERRRVHLSADPPTTKKLMSADDSDYDNN